MKKLFSVFLAITLFSLLFGEWSNDPSENNVICDLGGEDALPKIAWCLNGSAYIGWFSSQADGYNVRLQLLDEYGNEVWEHNGLLVSDHPSMSWLTQWDMACDHENNALLVFQDIRNGENNDVFAYKISPSGEFLWGDDGIELSTNPGANFSPTCTVTNNNSLIAAWQSETEMYIQKVSADGTIQFGEAGIVYSETDFRFTWPQLLPNGDDGFFMKYYKDSGPAWAPTRHMLAERFDDTGNPQWGAVIVSDAGGISAWTQILPFLPDDEEGFFIGWNDDRDNDMISSVYVQHVDSEGEVFFEDGIRVSLNNNHHNFYPFLAFSEISHSLFAIWNEMDGDQNLRGIFAQRFDNGERLWGDNGMQIEPMISPGFYPIGATEAGNGFTIFYEQSFDAISSTIKARRIDQEGNNVWGDNAIMVNSVASEKIHPQVSNFSNNEWIVSWEDRISGNANILAQNLNSDGSLGNAEFTEELSFTPEEVVFDTPASLSGIELQITNEGQIDAELTGYGLSEPAEWYYDIQFPFNFSYTLIPGETVSAQIIPIFPVTQREFLTDTLYIMTLQNTYSITLMIDEELVGVNENETIPGDGIQSLYPNPFKNTAHRKNGATIAFNVPKTKTAELLIYNLKGQKSVSLGNFGEGSHSINWDGTTTDGKSAGTGVYFCVLKMNNSEQLSIKKFMVLN